MEILSTEQQRAMADTRAESTDARAPLLGPRSSKEKPKCTLFTKHNLDLASGPLATVAIVLASKYFSKSSDGEWNHKIGSMLGVLVWMACWWILGPIPIAVTSLLPLVLFPLFKIMDSDEVSAEYTNSIVVLLIGTFILALGIEKYNLHKRIALKILLTSGGQDMNPGSVVLGFLSGATFVSLWMSDTVAAVMLIPVAMGVLNSLKVDQSDGGPINYSSSSTPRDEERGAAGMRSSQEQQGVQADTEHVATATAIEEFGKGLILAVTYGSALGGMGTLIGSGPNVILPGFYRKRFRDEDGLNFLSWSKFAIPLLIPYVICTWLFLAWYFCPPSNVHLIAARMDRRMVEKDYEALGPMSFPEIVILSEFLVLIVLWVTRVFGASPGWGILFDNFPSDGTMALLAAILLFIIPNKDKQGEMVMDWKSCKELSWSVILLVGGGFALSKGIQLSGLAALIAENFQFLAIVPYYLVTPVITIILSIITEFSSNVSVATLFLPILAEVAVSVHYHPLLLMVPATFGCNFSYNLPSATPPNAIALGSGHLRIKDMVYPGLFMHGVGLLLITIFTPTLGAYVFGLNVPL